VLMLTSVAMVVSGGFSDNSDGTSGLRVWLFLSFSSLLLSC